MVCITKIQNRINFNSILLLFFLLFSTINLFAVDDNYKNSKLYWKKKPPYPGYWQQDVHYQIDATLDVAGEFITARENLTYTNNSTDTLTVVYFHLYQNAFVKNSYYNNLEKNNKVKSQLSFYESLGNGTNIDLITQNGKAVATQLDNTILKVKLAEPILPGASTTFDIRFQTYFGRGSQRRRMKLFDVPEIQPNGSLKMVKHFDVVHWYPRICVYDKKFKWETDQHLTREFYGDFGVFDVNITMPDNYVLDGTGVLQNENEILPQNLRAKLDIKNFKNKPLGFPAVQILPVTGKKKTWRYHAEGVHDFAFTADPTYRIGEAEWNGVRCIALAREENAAGWQDAAEFTAGIIRVFSEDMGQYAYPKMIVADAKDGMEYPMLTLDGGITPEYKGLLVHEVGHNWFFGMLGTNETYRAFMDEGFTQFLTAHGLERLEGKYDPANPRDETRFAEVYHGYLQAARDHYDGFLNTHSDHFHGALGQGGGYGQVYFKTATMLYNLQYLLGKDVFFKAMQFYFDRWKFAHPYPEDFRQAIIDYTKTDLNWFFDQWLETDKKIDYKIGCVRQKGDYLEIKFRRKGRMQMPIDFDVVSFAGDTLKYTIPNTYYTKNEEGRQALPYWLGWDKLNPTYTARLPYVGKVKKIQIDPSYRLADINLLDNSTDCVTEFKFMRNPRKIAVQDHWKKYLLNLHPNLWWNAYSGLQIGGTLAGSYFKEAHNFRATVWFNSGWLQRALPMMVVHESFNRLIERGAENNLAAINSYSSSAYHPVSVRFQYSTPLPIGKLTDGLVRAEFRDGLQLYSAGVNKKFAIGNKNTADYHRIVVSYKYILRDRTAYLPYLINPFAWEVERANATVNLSYERNYPLFHGYGNVSVKLRGNAPGSDVAYSTMEVQARHDFNLGKKLFLKTRVFAQYADGILPMESRLYIAGGNPEAMFENDFYRSRGFFPDDWGRLQTEPNHLHFGGGLNIRGYTGVLLLLDDENYYYDGNSGAALNLELEFQRLSPIRFRRLGRYFKLQTYLFYDGGVLAQANPRVGFDGLSFDKLSQNAGLGLALTLKRLPDFALQLHDITLRCDFPLYLNRPPMGQDAFAFRWLVGIGRAF